MDYNLLIEKAKKAGIEAIEIYVSESFGIQVSISKGEVEQNKITDAKAHTIRAIYNDKMTAYTTEKADEDPDFIIECLKENATIMTTEEEFAIFSGSESYPEGRKANPIFNETAISKKIDDLKALEDATLAYDERIFLVPHCQYVENNSHVRIINSYGLDVEKQIQFAYFAVHAVAKENEQTQSAFEVQIARDYRNFNVNTLAAKVGKKAIEMLNAKPVISKSYPVIFDNKTMADLIATFSSIFSGDAAIKQITPLLGKEGELIFDKRLNFIDDPLFEDSYNYQPFDDEGVASYKKHVVQNGKFTTFLHNLKTAKYFKKESTANGYKRGAEIGVAPTNLYLSVPEEAVSSDEMIASIDEGLLITNLAGLHSGANPINGDFSAQASGFLIEGGKIVRPVTLIVVSGNFITMLNQVDAIGNDFYLSHNNIGTPSLKIKRLPVSGL